MAFKATVLGTFLSKRFLGLFLFLLLPLCAFALLGCENKYQKLESAYYANHYLEAVEAAADGYFDPSIRPKVSDFLEKYGDKLFDKAFLQGDEISQNADSEEGVLFWSRMLVATQKLQQNDAPIPALKALVSSCESRMKNSTRKYIDSHWATGEKLFQEQKYRESISHLENAMKYARNQPEIADLYAQAKEKAMVVVVIYPFYTPTDSMPAQVRALFSTLNPSSSKNSKEKENSAAFHSYPTLQGIRISSRFIDSLIRALDKQKSPYLNFVVAGGSEEIPETVHLVLKGMIQPDEQDTQSFPERETRSGTLQYTRRNYGDQEWFSSHFEYVVYKNAYRVNLLIEGVVMHPTQNVSFARVKLPKRAETSQEYRDKDVTWPAPPDVKNILYPIEYDRLLDVPVNVDKRDLVKQAVDEAAEEFAEKLLKQIDSDLKKL